MNLLRIGDIGDGRIQVYWRRGDEGRSYPKPIPFAERLPKFWVLVSKEGRQAYGLIHNA